MKYIWGILLPAALLFGGCMKNDIEDLKKKQQENEARIAALEEWQKTVNSQISSLQGLVAALETNDYVAGVTPVMESGRAIGYTVTFTKSDPITIYHGEKGDRGHSPVIGVERNSDGKYYWTLDGEWLTDEAGGKIAAKGEDGEPGDPGDPGDPGNHGTTPKVAIGDDGNWYVSADGTATGTPPGEGWADTGVAAEGTDGDAFFDGAPVDMGDSWKFTLADGTEITLPKHKAFKIGDDDSHEVFLLKDRVATDIPLSLPSGFAEGDHTSIMAQITTDQGTDTHVVTRASASPWDVVVTPPTFTEGVYNGDAKVTVTPDPSVDHGESAILKITIVGSDGSETTATRPLRMDLQALNTEFEVLVSRISQIRADIKGKEDYCTAISWSKLQDALTAAENVANTPYPNRAAVGEAFVNLETAHAGLSADKGKLTRAIQEALSLVINEEDYTTDSWDALQDALVVAQWVANDPRAMVYDVFEAENDLRDAIDNLVPKPVDNTALEAALEELVALIAQIEAAIEGKEDDYTYQSWLDLHGALTAARGAAKDASVDLVGVEAAIDLLNYAYGGLVKIEE